MATEMIVFREAVQPGTVQLRGSTEADHEILLTVPTLTDFKMTTVVPRNLGYHKMFFAMLRVAFDYMDEGVRAQLNILTQEELLNRLKLDLGLYDLTILAHDAPGLPAGTALYKPQSISFARMDDTQFKQFFKACIGVLIGKYIPAQNEQSLMAILRFDG